MDKNLTSNKMNANELRVGNLVNYNGDPLKIIMIRNRNYDDFEPIPLTEEWLLKFGFELMPWGWVITHNIKNKKYISRTLRITKKLYFERDGGDNVKIEYVHQLQNLYFALTGEEL